MTKPTMTSQWDPGSYRPLDMSKIPGYPKKMPPRYELFLPRFDGSDEDCPKSHMRRFWKFFQHFPVDDEAEDLVMKLFSSSLHGEARRWYDKLLAASIDSMERFERVFLARWTMEMEDIQSLLKRLEDVKQAESETVRDYCVRFRRSLYQIPHGCRPEDKYLIYLYTNGLQVHLSFLLNKRKPKTLPEAHKMAMQIEKSLFMTKTDAMDTLSTMKLVSHETFVENTQERGEQIVDQQNGDIDEEQEPENNNEVSTCAPPTDEVMQEPISPVQQSEDEVSYLPLRNSNNTVLLDSKEEEETEASYEMEAVHEDEAPIIAPQPNEALQDPVTRAEDEENEVSYFDSLDDTLFYDSENEEGVEALDEVEVPCCAIEDKEAVHEDEAMTHAENIKLLEVPAQEEKSHPPLLVFDNALPCNEKEEEDESSNPACYDTDTDIADFDEFIHVGRRRWDVIGYDLDPIYDTESHLKLLPLQLS
jgi:hypothetical protein